MPDNSGATGFHDLPESIIIWEILVRLPPKDALRCRAVRRSWRRATSAPDFLLAHHRHQPSFPVIKHFPDGGAASDDRLLAVFRGAGGGIQKLLPILRYSAPRRDPVALLLHASRDGLLVVSDKVSNAVSVYSRERESIYSRERFFYVCNPATGQCAPLPQLAEHGRQVYTTSIAGLYLHRPSEEYRLLYTCWTGLRNRNADFYIMAIGSDEPRRFIGRPPPSSTPSVEQALLKGLPNPYKIAPVLHRSGLHWDLGRCADYYSAMCGIMVFDTAVETFRSLRRPAQAPFGSQTVLLEMDGALALFNACEGVIIEVFVMQDYEEEVWVLRHRIDLSAKTTELSQFDLMLVMVNEREMLIQLLGHLLHCDIDGEVLGIVECHDKEGHRHPILITTHLLQESIVPLALQQGTGASKDPPFFLGH